MNKTDNEQLKKQYEEMFPVGTRIRLIHMDDTQAPPEGTIGTVKGVDDLCSVEMVWDTGSTLSLMPEIDTFEILKGEE